MNSLERKVIVLSNRAIILSCMLITERAETFALFVSAFNGSNQFKLEIDAFAMKGKMFAKVGEVLETRISEVQAAFSADESQAPGTASPDDVFKKIDMMEFVTDEIEHGVKDIADFLTAANKIMLERVSNGAYEPRTKKKQLAQIAKKMDLSEYMQNRLDVRTVELLEARDACTAHNDKRVRMCV